MFTGSVGTTEPVFFSPSFPANHPDQIPDLVRFTGSPGVPILYSASLK